MIKKDSDHQFDIGYVPVTREEELALYHKFKTGNQEAGEALVKSILPWTIYLARKLAPKMLIFDDDEVVSLAHLAAWKTVCKYDPERFKTRLTTYAAWWVRGVIKAGRDQLIRRPMSQPGTQVDCVRSLNLPNAQREYDFELASGVKDTRFENPYMQAARTENLELQQLQLRWAISRLPWQERQLLEMVTYEYKNQSESAEVLGMTRERARQRKESGEARLRMYIKHAPTTIPELKKALRNTTPRVLAESEQILVAV